MKNIPVGVIPRLKQLAFARGMTVTLLCRTVLIEYALKMGGFP